MHFAEPFWLFLGAGVVTVVALLLVRAEHLRSKALAVLEGARLRARSASPSRTRRWLRVAVATFAVAMGFVALARPQKGMYWETVDRSGVDLLLVVDTSKSMDADDVVPTRLERAKLAIADLVNRFPGDRIGLVAFAGDAFEQSPMTLDHTALLESLDALDTSVIAHGGTNIGRAIDVAAGALATEPARQKIMVLVTDGEDLEGQGLAEATRAAAAGITIDTVGVGTVAGEIVPARDARGRVVGVTHDEDGAPVRSHLDESGLEAIAAATHGTYRPLGVDGRGLDRLYDESLAPLTHTEASSRTHLVYSEWFEVPLALSLAALVLEELLGRRWRGLAPASRRPSSLGRAAVGGLAGMLLLALPVSAFASVASAAKAYAAGNFAEAAKEFEAASERDPKDARLAFNAGDAAYRAGDYVAAEAAFKRALAADPTMKQSSLYNEGDVLYRSGAALPPEARDETIANWKAAIEAYDGAIAANPKDADAIYNRDFVKRKLAALEEQKKEPPKDDQKDEKNGDKKNDKNGDGKQDKSKNGGGRGDDKSPKNGASGKPTASAGSSGSSQQPPKPGAGTPQGQPSHGAEGNERAEGGGLSPKEARALLGSLRGGEKRNVRRASGTPQPIDDTSGRDW